MIIKILFICRRHMAEFVMKDLVKKARLETQFHIESTATSTEEIGNPVYPPASRKPAEHGSSCEGKTCRNKLHIACSGVFLQKHQRAQITGSRSF